MEVPALVVAEAKNGLLKGVIGNSGNQPSLLGDVEIGKDCFKLELWRCTPEANVRRFVKLVREIMV